MSRTPFSQVLKNAKVDLCQEYDRLFELFYSDALGNNYSSLYTVRDFCASNFVYLPFRGTCITLEDFEETFGFEFVQYPDSFDIDYLLSFCEYTYNIASSCNSNYKGGGEVLIHSWIQRYLQHVLNVIEKIGYMQNVNDGITDFVPKDQVAISVAEIIDPSLSYRVIEYNHHSMKGDLDRKKAILLAFYDQLEPQRSTLSTIDSALADNLFFLFNNVNIRHNNTDVSGGKNYHPKVAKMKETEIENWYDDTYQLCLQAFLELDNEERKAKAKKLKDEIKTKKQ